MWSLFLGYFHFSYLFFFLRLIAETAEKFRALHFFITHTQLETRVRAACGEKLNFSGLSTIPQNLSRHVSTGRMKS